MTTVDRSHDPGRTSWVPGADGHPHFPIQNLPYAATGEGIAVAIGDHALLLREAMTRGLRIDDPALARAAAADDLGELLALAPEQWRELRLIVGDALGDPSFRGRLEPAVRPIADLVFRMPFVVGDYTDFYASVYHATNVGSMFRPDNPLLPNYKWVPIGYHGRGSTVVPSGTVIRRPHGQLKAPDSPAPSFGPSRSLDYELELGLVLGGRNPMGEPVRREEGWRRIFGVVLLNDWSARDVQGWEYQPLGPFLAKNFATSISPWVVTADALLPFRANMPERPAGDPAPLDYLTIPGDHTWSIELEVFLCSREARERGEPATRISTVDYARAMYWSPAQMVVHHGSNGCELRPGDLLGTGTISGPMPDSRGCLLERTWRGAEPITLADGSVRRFLEDGDEVVMTGRCSAPGTAAIGFGECRGVIEEAV